MSAPLVPFLVPLVWLHSISRDERQGPGIEKAAGGVVHRCRSGLAGWYTGPLRWPGTRDKRNE